eukprot:m.343529 g.343529  ORF g.343529 m.343529 type:complete len:307 (-) comp22965_c0_seq1:44-964(-)
MNATSQPTQNSRALPYLPASTDPFVSLARTSAPVPRENMIRMSIDRTGSFENKRGCSHIAFLEVSSDEEDEEPSIRMETKSECSRLTRRHVGQHDDHDTNETWDDIYSNYVHQSAPQQTRLIRRWAAQISENDEDDDDEEWFQQTISQEHTNTTKLSRHFSTEEPTTTTNTLRRAAFDGGRSKLQRFNVSLGDVSEEGKNDAENEGPLQKSKPMVAPLRNRSSPVQKSFDYPLSPTSGRRSLVLSPLGDNSGALSPINNILLSPTSPNPLSPTNDYNAPKLARGSYALYPTNHQNFGMENLSLELF